MKKRFAITAVVVAALAVAAVPFVYAGPGGHRGAGHHGGGDFAAGMIFSHLRHVADELELSDAQLDEIKSIVGELRTQNEPYREQLHGGFHDVALTLVNNPNDLVAAQALLDRQAAAEKALKSNMLAATSQALNVLTPAQRTELAEMIRERSERRSERSERRSERRSRR